MRNNLDKLVDTNQQRIKRALDKVHSAASEMDSGELKLFVGSQLGEAFLTCASLYGETQSMLAYEFLNTALNATTEARRKELEKLDADIAEKKLALRMEWGMEDKLSKCGFDRAKDLDVFVYSLYGTRGTISLKSDRYKSQYKDVPYPDMREAMLLLYLLKPVPLYLVKVNGSQSIQHRSYAAERAGEYVETKPILPVWLEYKGAVPGHEEFIHVNWISVIEGQHWRVSVHLLANDYGSLMRRSYRVARTPGEKAVEDVNLVFGPELRDMGLAYQSIKWATGSNEAVNEYTVYFKEEGWR